MGAALGGDIESDFAAPAWNDFGVHLQVFAGHVRWAERLPGFGGAALRIELIQQANRGRQLFDTLGHEAGDPGVIRLEAESEFRARTGTRPWTGRRAPPSARETGLRPRNSCVTASDPGQDRRGQVEVYTI